ncbi:MAG: DUF481 domain-containing protein [Thermodesulfobacteriota bacterium]
MLRIITGVLIVTVFISFVHSNAFAVGGISNSKIIVPSAETVPSSNFEIEPFFSFLSVDNSVDSKNYEAGLRFTKGILDNLEAGVNIIFFTVDDNDIEEADYNFGDLLFGVKYRFYESHLFSLAYQGGFTVPTSSTDTNWVFEPGGLIFTKNITDKLSIDADGVFGFDEEENVFVTSNLGIGYYITDNLQTVFEMNYLYENPDNGESSNILSLTTGFTANLNSFTTLIIGFSWDVVSENADDAFLFTSALTLLF